MTYVNMAGASVGYTSVYIAAYVRNSGSHSVYVAGTEVLGGDREMEDFSGDQLSESAVLDAGVSVPRVPMST